MVNELFSLVLRHKGQVTFGTVILLCFGFMYWQSEKANQHADAERAAMREMFTQQSAQNNDMHSRQWQAQSRIADELKNVAIALNRIEAILFIPPAERVKKMPEAAKAAEAKMP